MSRFLQRRATRFGIPFILFMIGGSFGLREFTELRYRYRKITGYEAQEELKKQGFDVDKIQITSLESEYEKIKDKTFDEWGNSRIQRPYEE